MEDELAQQSNVIPLHPAPSTSGHLACSKCGTRAEIKCDCGVPYDYIPAREAAVKAIMKNPEMSNRAIAAKVGVVEGTVRNARKAVAGAQKYAPEKRMGRDGKKHPARKTSATPVPDGYSTLSEAICAGLEIERSGGSFQEAAAKSGLAPTSYGRGRNVVLLAERTDLSANDTETVKSAIQQMNDNRVLAYAYEAVRPIADKIWGKKGHRLKSDKKRIEAFSSALSYLLTVCTGASRITIPYLSKEQTDSALEGIKEAKQALDILQRRIRKGDGEYHE